MRLIKKTEYRRYEFDVSPQNQSHHDHIKKIYQLLEDYFKNRPDCDARRIILNSGVKGRRQYTINFTRLDESQMFELAFAEYIDTGGFKYE